MYNTMTSFQPLMCQFCDNTRHLIMCYNCNRVTKILPIGVRGSCGGCMIELIDARKLPIICSSHSSLLEGATGDVECEKCGVIFGCVNPNINSPNMNSPNINSSNTNNSNMNSPLARIDDSY